jgi:hypothetical protein
MPNTALTTTEKQKPIVIGKDFIVTEIEFLNNKKIAGANIDQDKTQITPDGAGVKFVFILKNAVTVQGDITAYKVDTSSAISVKFTLSGVVYTFKQGTSSLGEDKKTLTMSLAIPKKFKLDVFGAVEIKNNAGTKVAEIFVNAGNNNAKSEWILQSVIVDGKKSNLSVKALIDWSKTNTDGAEAGDLNKIDSPAGSGSAVALDDNFIIEINELELNVTAKTFKLDVSTAKDGVTKPSLKITNNITLTDLSLMIAYDYDTVLDREIESPEAES